MPRDLYHFTCDHGRQAIGETGLVLPIATHTPEAVAQLPEEWAWLAELTWFTDQTIPDPVALGLTRATIDCDRTTYRYRVTDRTGVLPWREMVRLLPRNSWQLTVGGHRPGWWWVARGPVPVRLDG